VVEELVPLCKKVGRPRGRVKCGVVGLLVAEANRIATKKQILKIVIQSMKLENREIVGNEAMGIAVVGKSVVGGTVDGS
jgi:hypothetical protein